MTGELARASLTPSAIWAQIAQTGAARALGLVLSIGTLAISARYLGPAGRGAVAAAFAWVSVLAVIGGLSLGQIVIHLAAGKRSDEWLPSVMGSLLPLVAVVTVLIWAGVAATYVASSGSVFNHLTPAMLALAFVGLPLFIWSDLVLSLLQALDALRVYNVAQVAGAVIQPIAVLVFVVAMGLGVHGALGAILIAQALPVGVCLVAVYRRAGTMRPEWGMTVRLLKGAAKLHLNAIGTILFTQANVLMVNYFCRVEDTGYYQLATQLVIVLQLLPVSISIVAYAIVARDGADTAWHAQRILLAKGIGLTLLAIAGAYVAAPWLVTLLAGQSFLPAVPLFRLMLPSLIGMTMSIVMASQWIGRGLFFQVSALTCAIGFLTIAGNAWLLPRVGVIGAVYTTLGVYGVSMLVNGGMALWVERRWKLSCQAPIARR